jgi:hypothetical protein
MPRLTLVSTLLGVTVLLGGVSAAATLGAQAPPTALVIAPSAAPHPAATATVEASPPSKPVAESATARVSGPWASTAAFRTVTPATSGGVIHQGDTHVGAGKNLAMMGVGAAAAGIGLIVGDTAGTSVAVGGGLLGLYGLYRFLK